MKRWLCFFAAALFCTAAYAQRIRDIDITVDVDRDGSAWITQEWDVNVTEGTEWYIPVGHLGPMTIGDLQVWENGQAFESVGDDWDSGRSRSWKSGKCGILRKRDGVELCWGQGAYGDHRWTARFRVTGLVQALDDADAFNFMFVNPGMAAPPEHARVTVRPAFDTAPWTSSNTRVWGFGFYGDIHVKDGAVVAESSEAFGRDSRLIALVKFEKGMFAPSVIRDGSFQTMLDRALEGSSYGADEDDFWETLIAIVLTILFCALGIGAVLYVKIASARGNKWRRKMFGKKKIDGWYREAPLEGNLMAAQYVLSKGRRFFSVEPQQHLIGAYFLRWIMDGHLTVEADPSSDKRVNLAFKADSVSADEVEEDLYQMARSASGDNRLLEKNEFERWSAKHYRKVTAWPDRAVARGASWFRAKGYLCGSDACTPAGQQEACHVVEFQNFLKDFTLSDQRAADEVALWKDYLVYAQLFGIADKVAAQFRKLYPAQFEDLSRSVGMDSRQLWYAMNWTQRMSSRALANATAKAGSVSGGGGHTSFGGGGGFSGGGFGGGSR